jgi:hypothetical protein
MAKDKKKKKKKDSDGDIYGTFSQLKVRKKIKAKLMRFLDYR